MKFVTEADGRHDMRLTQKHACDINLRNRWRRPTFAGGFPGCYGACTDLS